MGGAFPRGNAVGLSANGGILDVRAFHLHGDAWQLLGQDLAGERLNDEFGASIAMTTDGRTLAWERRIMTMPMETTRDTFPFNCDRWIKRVFLHIPIMTNALDIIER